MPVVWFALLPVQDDSNGLTRHKTRWWILI